MNIYEITLDEPQEKFYRRLSLVTGTPVEQIFRKILNNYINILIEKAPENEN